MERLFEALGGGLRALAAQAGRFWRWARAGGLRGLLALLPLVLCLGWLGWIALDRTGVKRGIEAAARDFVAYQRVRSYREELLFAARESGVDAYLLAGVLWVESSGRIDAVSSAGALGLFQLKPITFEWRAELMGLPIPTAEEILSDALLSARIGADNIAWLLDTYDGEVERALLAYNAGPGRLSQLEDAAGGWRAFRDARRAAGDSQLFAYADKVLRYAEMFRSDAILDADVDLFPALHGAPDAP